MVQEDFSSKTLLLEREVAYLNNQLDFFTEQDCNVTFDIFGKSRFETTVTGYLTTRKIVWGENSLWDETEVERAYLIITKFQDNEFRDSISTGIEKGNSVNVYEDGDYLFNLGCFEKGEITWESNDYHDEGFYLDSLTHKKILDSTQENPVTITLYFDFHVGRGCFCCNLAEKIRTE